MKIAYKTETFSFDDLNGSPEQITRAENQAKELCRKYSGEITFFKGTVSYWRNGKPYYNDPSCWPRYVVSWEEAEKQGPIILEKGQRVYVEGDGPEICTANYTEHIASWATVVDEPSPDDDYVKLSIDKVGGDRHAWVYVLKESIRNTPHCIDEGTTEK